MKGRTKKFQGRRYELISWEEILEKEEAAGHDLINRDWEDQVCEALDDEAYYNYIDYDSPIEAETMRILHR